MSDPEYRDQERVLEMIPRLLAGAVLGSTLPSVAMCYDKPLIDLTCTFARGSEGREATEMTFQIDLNTPRVILADGAWVYQKRPASNVFGEDTISIRQDEHTGEIIMSALRADIPVLLRFNPADGTLHYAYASHDGLYSFTYNCR